ncbi:hypothetical protein AURANDRAFT_68652 [Aureococcus anophagefferens]|uniref:Uncharacterized protein n=1 Tax=Aureococcus anophagefferens TaxID=44056 RepID=F0YQB7_AURAN|nr:hypothetical protein AURANDRAFT_68652 [Aureococcus anophagefferens]EGB02692.1 hypothetical protein AURANDRAFT_68652 [Aureococcus anophagefferens]|eukprot:XP_009042608.1 hypothetical protein AURANDRAFT_68652 [Aureococcus anophagefferens]
MASRAPPSSFDSESSSDESSLSSGDESSDDEEDVAPKPIEAAAADEPAAKPADEPAAAPKPAPTVAASPPRKQRKVDPEKLTLYLLAAGWTKVSINHQSNWLDTFGVAYSSSRAILTAYPELYDHCA